MVELADIFLEECPASPIGHITALRSVVEGSPSEYPLGGGAPNDATIYLTHSCNLRCRHCYLSAGRPLPGELTADQWIAVLDGVRELGVRYAYFLGGEPMMLFNRGLLKIIRHAKDIGLYVSMSTNGLFINRRSALMLKEAGLDQVQVSLDGPTPEVNDAIRGLGSFEAAIKAIEAFREAGIPTSLSYTVTSENAKYVVDMVKLAESLNIPVLTFIRVQEFGRALRNGLTLRQDEADAVINNLLNVKASVKIVLNGFRFHLRNLKEGYDDAKAKLARLRVVGYSTCPAGVSRFVIDSDGEVYGCELLMNKTISEGNVLRDDLKEIWARGFRMFRARSSRNIEPCNTCPFADLCNAGCTARAYSRYGTFNAPDPQCPIVKGFTKIRMNTIFK